MKYYLSYLYFALEQQVRTRFEAWTTTEFKQLWCDLCLRDTTSVPETDALLSPAELGASEASALSSLRVPRSIDSVGGPQIRLDSGRIPARGGSRRHRMDVFADGADSCGGDGGRSDLSELPRTSPGSDVREERWCGSDERSPRGAVEAFRGEKTGNCQWFGESHTPSCRRALAKQEVALPCVQTALQPAVMPSSFAAFLFQGVSDLGSVSLHCSLLTARCCCW